MVSRNRGRKKSSATDLINEFPDEADFFDVFGKLQTESDRSVAVIAGELVSLSLKTAISGMFVQVGEDHGNKLFNGPQAPLSTFHSKILLGRSLGFYGAKTEKMLLHIKNIRNTFAHTVKPVDFNHPLIHKECERLLGVSLEGELEAKTDTARERYLLRCQMLAVMIARLAFMTPALRPQTKLP